MAKVWMPDYPPASANASDDEFSDSSVAVAWTEWDVPNELTVVENDYGLSLLQASQNSGYKFGGVFKAAPSGDWQIWAKLGFCTVSSSYPRMGLLLGQDLTNNPSTSDLINFYFIHGTINQLGVQSFSAYNAGSGSDIGATVQNVGTTIYQRIRHVSTTLYYDYSTDGISWYQIASGAEPFTPAEVGFCINNYNTNVSIRGVVSFFRVVAGTPAMTDIMNGRRVL